MTKKTLLLLSTALLLNLQDTWAMQEDIDHYVGKKILIKNTKYNEYLYLSRDTSHHFSDGSIVTGTRVSYGNTGVFDKSIFTIEKGDEGYLIKNIKYNSYLYVTDTDRVGGLCGIGGDRIIEASKDKDITNNYFKILKDNKGYKIKSLKHSEFLLLSSNSTCGGGDRVMKSWKKAAENSFFEFVELDEKLFPHIK